MPLASRLRQAACRRQLENHLRHSVPALRLLYARGARSACTRVASAIVQGRLSTTAAWQSAGRDGLFQRLLFIGSRWHRVLDRKSTRLNSSHLVISYAVFCLKKKKNIKQ